MSKRSEDIARELSHANDVEEVKAILNKYGIRGRLSTELITTWQKLEDECNKRLLALYKKEGN